MNVYASGELPEKGDLIVHADKECQHPEANQSWIVTTICEDMVRAKCNGAPLWRQAFYISKMNLAKRKEQKI